MISDGNMSLPKQGARFTKFDSAAVVSVFLVANAFVWYFFAARTLDQILNDEKLSNFYTLPIWGIHFAALLLSLIGGALLVNKIGRRRLFIFWILIGMVSPLPLALINSAQIPILLLTAVLFGVSIGLGMPNCMELFSKSTRNDNRGRYGGITMFSSAIGFFFLALIDIGNIGSIAILLIWRLIALTVFFMTKPFDEEKTTKFIQDIYTDIDSLKGNKFKKPFRGAVFTVVFDILTLYFMFL